MQAENREEAGIGVNFAGQREDVVRVPDNGPGVAGWELSCESVSGRPCFVLPPEALQP